MRMESIPVITYSTTKNAMGQSMTTEASRRNVDMYITPYSNSVVSNPRFNDCEYIALTKDRDVTVGQSISYQDSTFDIDYIIPSFRFNQLFLRKFN